MTETLETEDFEESQLVDSGLDRPYQAWATAHAKKGALPSRADIDVLTLKDFLARLTLYDVIDGGQDFRYRVHATDSAVVLGEERTGKRRSEINHPPERRARMDARLRRVVASARPLLSRLPSQTGAPPHFVTRLFLPLATDGAVVDMILVVREPLVSRSRFGPYL